MEHVKFMQRCLDLALNGEGTTSPNPMVGCVIVHDGKIIGEGWHKKAGEPHAEVNAIASVKYQSLLTKSTLYVSLEPCSHHGRTPPCASLIIQEKIPRVVVACLDPNPQVAGSGIALLREAGIDVTVAILEAEALELNKKFITFHKEQRSFVTLKWAQSTDGFMDMSRINAEKGSFAISGAESKAWVHHLRAIHDAILIGPNSALNDNPSLTVREVSGKDPIRLILDRQNRLPDNLTVFRDGGRTIHFVAKKSANAQHEQVAIEDVDFLAGVLNFCYNNRIQSILVEGGAEILNAFISGHYWDEAFVIVASMQIQKGLMAPQIAILANSKVALGKDLIMSYKRNGVFGS